MELTEEKYLEHVGKKGMKWGVRNAAVRRARDHKQSGAEKIVNKQIRSLGQRHRSNQIHKGTRTAGQKLIIGGAAIAGVGVGSHATTLLLNRHGNKPMRALVGAFGASALGVHMARGIIDKNNDIRLAALKNHREAIRVPDPAKA